LHVQIELVITMIDGYTPGLVISPEFSRFAAAIDAYIDIDMYVWPFMNLKNNDLRNIYKLKFLVKLPYKLISELP